MGVVDASKSGRIREDTNNIIIQLQPQDLKKCSPKGRDCIEKRFVETFSCNVTCEGIHADVIKMKGEDPMQMMEGQSLEQFYERDLQRLIFEYKEFKRSHVRHIRFNSEASTTMFGKSCSSSFES